MDIFKLLSRSTKLSKNSASRSPTGKIPSSGEPANPQLFGHYTLEYEDSTTSTSLVTSRKRKRGQEVPIEKLPAELDFFGEHDAGQETAGSRRREKKDTQANGAKSNGTITAHEGPAGSDGPKLLSEEECKQVLRTHKLKITVLEDFEARKAASEADQKPKERKKAKGPAPGPAHKKAKIQLYPQPLTSFAQLRSRYGISGRLAENIEAQGYTLPTEVQLGSLPLLLAPSQLRGDGTPPAQQSPSLQHGVDLLTVAPTGSGKTLAFLIPVINALLRDRKSWHKDRRPVDREQQDARPGAVIIAPTKELASQIVNEGRKLALGTGVRISLMRKGMTVVPGSTKNNTAEDGAHDYINADEQNASESEEGSDAEDRSEARMSTKKRSQSHLVKADILVSTPLTFLNALKTREDTTSPLPSVRHLVLDEADVLLDPLFRDQTLAIWAALTDPSLRTTLWSATMGSSIEDLARTTIKQRHESHSPRIPAAPLLRLVVGLKDTALPTITHKLTYCATEHGKLLALRQLLHPTTSASSSTSTDTALRPPFLVFTQTIPRATALHAELLYDIPPEAGGSSRIAVLHSGLSDAVRDNVMARFRRGEVWVLITTDLLARGVDFRGVNGVVNYDMPTSGAAYVHRVGRTGRAGREGGVAVTLYAREDVPFLKGVANVVAASQRMAARECGGGEEGGVQQWFLDALPTPTKREKQMLKKRGVEARRAGLGEDGKGKARNRISTKSGFDRRVENRRKGAVMGSRLRRAEEG